MMKNIFSVVLIGLSLLSFSSCNDFLTEIPTTSIPDEEAFESARDYDVALHGVYNYLGAAEFMGRDALAMSDVASDQSAHSVATSHFYDIFAYQVLETNTYIKDIWSYGYKVINFSARIIDASKTATDFSEEDIAAIDACVAQAYGLKALSEFILVNYFALPYSEANKSTLGIVNQEKTVLPGETIGRTTVEENYKLILSDIENAKKYFDKENVEDVGYFYMNRAAVSALEARVRLYMKDYDGAIAAAEEAIGLRGGSIVSTEESYKNMFYRLDISSEDLFVISKTETDYLTANSLNTLYKDYGVSVNETTRNEFASTDIRLSVLNVKNKDGEYEWTGGKLSGLLQNGQHLDIQNVPVLRLPEVYLNLAEAYAMKANYKEARKNLLEVASKRNPDLDENAIKEDASIIPLILKERRLELVQEGHRFFDARRSGEKIDVSNGDYTNFDIAKFVYPIPAKEVNAAAGVTQTPNWDANLPK